MNFFHFDLMKEIRGEFSISFALHLMKQLESWERDGEEVVEKAQAAQKASFESSGISSKLNWEFVSLVFVQKQNDIVQETGRDECTKREANNGWNIKNRNFSLKS